MARPRELSLADVRSRVVRALEALQDGDGAFLEQMLDDLAHESWQAIECAPTSAAVARVVKPLEGRRVVRVVDGVGCVEIIFEGGEQNLLSIATDIEGPGFGSVQLGYIAPELVKSGYGETP